MTAMLNAGWTREQIAARAAQELRDGFYVNLGIGIPTLVANYIPTGVEVTLQSENGMLGMGPFPTEDEIDADLINAGKQTITELASSSYFSSADSFAMIRGGHLDLCVLGAFEVAENGDIANWATSENDTAPAVGGAMDLAVGAKRLWAVMEHTTREGRPRLLRRCSYPLTAPGVVKRVYTNLAVLDVTPRGFAVVEMAPGVSHAELQAKTEAELIPC
ncbi:3-oxoacid CoA-transferase subunit B [Phenylobacterium sp.]|uniref:3-oxoacid CoA-transferase subunit B n=1 Tax=Phenylobacterium sp. TaxID=1871053 RepID=UPI00374DA656